MGHSLLPDLRAVMMHSEQNRCKHSFVVIVFFNRSRHMGHINSLCRVLGETFISVSSVTTSWGSLFSSYKDNSQVLLVPDWLADEVDVIVHQLQWIKEYEINWAGIQISIHSHRTNYRKKCIQTNWNSRKGQYIGSKDHNNSGLSNITYDIHRLYPVTEF